MAQYALAVAPFIMVYAGLRLLCGDGAALLGTGFLVWLDFQMPERGS